MFNTSIEEYTAIVLQISSQRIGGCLLPVHVDDLLFALYSMVRGNRRLQNDYQNAIAQVPNQIFSFNSSTDCVDRSGVRIRKEA